MTHYKPRKRKLTLAEIAAGMVVVGLLSAGALQAQALVENARVVHLMTQVKAFEAGVTTFKDSYGALPGDFLGAGKALKGCTGLDGADCTPWKATADDKKVGPMRTAYIHSFNMPETTHVPAQAAEDETILFWQHLSHAGLISGVTDGGIKNNTRPSFGTTHPAARTDGTGFTVVTMRDANFPFHSAPLKNEEVTMTGLMVVLVSDAVLRDKETSIAEGVQPLIPGWAAQLDRKMDDGKPYNGFVKAYGAAGCLHYSEEESLLHYWFRGMIEGREWPRGISYKRFDDGRYNENSAEKDCGLTFRIAELSK